MVNVGSCALVLSGLGRSRPSRQLIQYTTILPESSRLFCLHSFLPIIIINSPPMNPILFVLFILPIFTLFSLFGLVVSPVPLEAKNLEVERVCTGACSLLVWGVHAIRSSPHARQNETGA